MNNLIFTLILLPGLNLYAQSPEIYTIHIRTYDRCKGISVYENLDVTIRHLGGAVEDFDIDLRCDFNNDIDFQTSSGYQCSVKSGACSGFFPEEQVNIECRRGRDVKIASHEILCE